MMTTRTRNEYDDYEDDIKDHMYDDNDWRAPIWDT